MLNNKKIYINGRFLMSKPTGIQWYSYEICRALIRKGIEVRIICPTNGKICESFDIEGFDIVRFGYGASHFWEQLVLPLFFLFKRDYLLLCFSGLGPVLLHNKITTIHDLSFLVNPSWFSRQYYLFYKMLTPVMIRTSRHIITVSEFSKSEILRFYPFVKKDNISVVYNAVDKGFISESASPLLSDMRSKGEGACFLVVSSLDPRKNISAAIEAIKGMEGCRLKVVGENHRVFGEVGGLTSENVEFLGRKSHAELTKLYTEATALLFPSLYEGFGRPPIEAMQAGCLVLASDIPVLHEVCGDAAIFFNPHDTTEIRSAMRKVMVMNEKERERLIIKGYDNVGRFSWDKSADKIINIINILCE